MVTAVVAARHLRRASRPTAVWRRAVRQPLLHFIGIGALVFAAFAWLDDAPPPSRIDRIVVTETQVARLAEGFRAVWRRPPTAAELAGLVDDFVREEVYVREALALGLDRDDEVIRRRLRQKMEFLTASAAETLAPTEAELRAFHAEHRARFTTPPRVAFDQVFLGEAPSEGDVAKVLAPLERGAAHATLGERTLLPPSLPPSPANVVDGTFGRGVFETAFELAPGVWAGPLASAFGSHLVRVTERTTAESLPFEAVRAEVEAEWRRERAEALAEAHYESLEARYEIVRPEPTAP